MSLTLHEIESLAHDQLNKLEMRIKLLDVAKQLEAQLLDTRHQLEGITDLAGAVENAKAVISSKIAEHEPPPLPFVTDTQQ